MSKEQLQHIAQAQQEAKPAATARYTKNDADPNSCAACAGSAGSCGSSGGGSSGSCGTCGCGSCACGTGGGECGYVPRKKE